MGRGWVKTPGKEVAMPATHSVEVPGSHPLALRPARISDMFLLMDLADQVGYRLNPEWIRTRLSTDPAAEAHVVATEQDVPIAAAHLYAVASGREGGRPWARLTALVVDEDHRGHGIGTHLLAHCEGLARGLGAELLEIAIASGRHDLDGFWCRHGYRRHPPIRYAKLLTDGA